MELGEIIGDKYRIIEVLGQGGTSVVYLAENLILNNLWAIKALSKKSGWYSYEIQEINILKDLNHSMLPRIADLVEDALFSYIVMDYISGANLLDTIQLNGKIQEKILLKWTRDLLDVLNYLHGKTPPIIYRDLKPANLIVDETGRIKLVDFGTALLHRGQAKEDTIYIGTHGYAAPEQYTSGESDPRTDLFNLGMTLIHLATGIHPLKLDKTPIQAALKQAGISSRFISFILNLVQSDPDRRPLNCGHATQRLDRIQTSHSPFLRDSHKMFNNGLKSIIAVSSILPGSGVTSFCMMLGTFFSKQGFHTAVAELNPSGDFERLIKIIENVDTLKYKQDDPYEAEGLTLYPSVQESSLIPKKRFDIVILDLGVLKSEQGVRELNRSDIKLVLCPGAFWKFPHIPNSIERLRPYAQEEWIYVVCTSQKHEEQILNKRYNLEPLVAFPSIQNPFCLLREEEMHVGRAMEKVFYLTGQKVNFKTGREAT